MPITENTPQRLVLKSGSTTLTIDKEAGKAILQRKFLFWNLKPAEAPLSDIADVTVDAAMDRASGVEVCATMLVMRTGAGWAFPASDKKDAQESVDAIRGFVGLASMPSPRESDMILLRFAQRYWSFQTTTGLFRGLDYQVLSLWSSGRGAKSRRPFRKSCGPRTYCRCLRALIPSEARQRLARFALPVTGSRGCLSRRNIRT